LFSQVPTTVPTKSRFTLTIPATPSTGAPCSLVPPPLKSAGNLIGHARISTFNSIALFYLHLLLFSFSRMAMMRGCRIGGFDVYDHVARLCSSSILLKHAESHVYLSSMEGNVSSLGKHSNIVLSVCLILAQYLFTRFISRIFTSTF